MENWGRIARLAGMLGSSNENERVNAANLVAVALRREGLSFADFTQRIANGSMIFGGKSDVRTVVVEKRVRPNPAAELAHAIIARAEHKLTVLERRFLNDILRMCEMTGGNCDLTAKQASWLAMLDQSYLTPAMPFKRTRKPRPITTDVLDDLGLGATPGTFKGEPQPRPTYTAKPDWRDPDVGGYRPPNDIPDARRDHHTKLHSGFAAREVDFDDDVGF